MVNSNESSYNRRSIASGPDDSPDAGVGKSRRYCLEMICADFLAGAHIGPEHPEILLQSIWRYYKFLPAPQQKLSFQRANRKPA